MDLRTWPSTLIGVVLITLSGSACSAPPRADDPAATSPPVIRLPDGFQAEGIATGQGTSFYAGSMRDGTIYRGDLPSGTGRVLAPGEQGRSALGMKVDSRNRLFVADRTAGRATVYDAATGARLADY